MEINDNQKAVIGTAGRVGQRVTSNVQRLFFRLKSYADLPYYMFLSEVSSGICFGDK